MTDGLRVGPSRSATRPAGRSTFGRVRRPGEGSSSEKFRLLADKAYSHNSTRAKLRSMRIPHTIPERSDQITCRKARGSAGGRPPGFNTDLYRQRNTVERGYSRLKHWRGIATRNDKYALTFLGGDLLATIITYHRVRELPDTT